MVLIIKIKNIKANMIFDLCQNSILGIKTIKNRERVHRPKRVLHNKADKNLESVYKGQS